MSRSFRAIGARARQQALRTLLIAGAASVGTGLLLTACSNAASSGGGTASSSGNGAAHRAGALAPVPGKFGVPQINLVLKIPAAQFTRTVTKLSAPDLGKRLSFSQLRALLSRAGSVSQLLSVQNEINSQESNLEALLAQQRALTHETSYGTVTILLVGHHARVVKKHKKTTSHGFLAGLRGGWHALGLVVGWALTALGSALPFLIPAVLIGAIAFESRRRLARKKGAPALDPPTASAS